MFLGIDLGTQSLKAVVAGRDFRVAGRGRSAYRPDFPAPGHAEQDPKDWEAALAPAIAQALQAAGCGPADIAGIGVAGQLDGCIGLDASGRVVHPALIWQDKRATEEAERAPAAQVFGITGHCPAGGTVLAIHADHRVMAAGEFRLGLNEVQVGLYPGPVIHGAFRRLVGGHAAQLLIRGALIDPATALRMGLVDELCEPAQCAARAVEVAHEIIALPRDAMLRTRAMVREELVALFGAPGDASRLSREFADIGTAMFSEPATRERLQKMFAKKSPS